MSGRWRKGFMALYLALAMGLSGCMAASGARGTPSPGAQASETAGTTAAATASVEPSWGGTAAPGKMPPVSLPNPDVDGTYIAACQEFITLRADPVPGARAIGKIPKGAVVKIIAYTGMYADVTYEGQRGYVLAGYLVRRGGQGYEKDLTIVKPMASYSYEQMKKDMDALADKYPDKVRVDKIGYSEEGRELSMLIIGNPNAPKKVLVQAAMHGREHMTALLAMAQAEYWLRDSGDDVCFHIIPMSNPDGVVISQKALMNDALRAIYDKDLTAGNTAADEQLYLRQWKANGKGVDLNRNFDAKWDVTVGRAKPSSSNYKGVTPEDAAESRALADYTREMQFDATVSYHAFGSVIFHSFGDMRQANAASRGLGNAVASVTGYPLDEEESTVFAGYKDWAIAELQIPSITIEIGTRECPLPMDEFTTVWERNKGVLGVVAQWVKARQ